MRVAFCGPAGTGKSTAAKYLLKKFGGSLLSFASPLKLLAYQLGWDGKKDERGRKFLQQLGMTVREYDEDYWLNALLDRIGGLQDYDNYFVDDLRFPNEYEGLKLNGFLIVRLEPRGFDLSGSWRSDASEVSLPKWMCDHRIDSEKNQILAFQRALDSMAWTYFRSEVEDWEEGKRKNLPQRWMP